MKVIQKSLEQDEDKPIPDDLSATWLVELTDEEFQAVRTLVNSADFVKGGVRGE